VEEVGALGVFEAALAALGEGGAEGACYDDIVGVLLKQTRLSLLSTRAGTVATTDVVTDLSKTLLGYAESAIRGPSSVMSSALSCRQ
jgi:hypothetical protein